MSDERKQLIDWLDADRERLVDFFRGFLRCPSPNPPGDTTIAATYIGDFLKR